MGAAAVVAFSFTALIWCAFLALIAWREQAPIPVRNTFLSYLVVVALWVLGALTLEFSPAAAEAEFALVGAGLLLGAVAYLCFVRAYLAWRLPRPGYGGLVGGFLSLLVAGGLRVQFPSVYGWDLLFLGISTALAVQTLFRRRLPPLAPRQRRSAGYAVLGLTFMLAYGVLAYATPFLSGPLGAALALAGGLLYAGLILCFPQLGDALGRWLERLVLRSHYEAQRLVEEVREAAPGVLDLEPLAGMILERTVQALDIRWGIFALWDRTTQELHAVTARGLSEEAVSAQWPADHPLTRWLVEGCDEAREEGLPYAQPLGCAITLDTAWIVPVRLREQPVGVFLYGPHMGGEPFNATERNVLDLLAEQTAAAVANARLFNQVARARREWLQTFDALSDGVFLHDHQGRILRANLALAGLVGRSFDEIISHPWYELIPAGPEPRLACSGKGPSAYDLGFGNRILHITLSSLEGAEFCVHVVRDVTDERALQLQLAQAEKLAAIGQLLSGVAHELNNPLTTIIGFSELLQDADVSAQVRSDLERIWRQAKRCSRIVQGLLTFARQSRVQLAEVDVNALLEQTLEFMETQLESHHITVELDLAEDLPHTLADAGQLQQLFLNLCTNALQAMSAAHGQGTLRISTQAPPTVIRITVRDDGPGIPPALQHRIFDPFFTTKGVGDGTGLGLSICYGIVREHGGRIWVESEPGQGASFTIELPVRHASVPPEPEPARRASRECTILVVEDEEPIVALITRVLQTEGHRIITAADGEQGLLAIAQAVARAQMPDLIVADIKMPRLDGPGFYERVCSEFPSLAERFLFITGDATRSEGAGWLAQTGLPCLRKPFGVHEISRAIAAALARGS